MKQVWAHEALTADGWRRNVGVTIDDVGRIAAAEPDASPAGKRVGVLLPAPTNLHSHTFQRALSGLAERRGPRPRDTFWSWRTVMYRFLDRLTPDDVEAIAAFAQVEMLEAGFAAVAEFHYLHHQSDGRPYDNLAELSQRIMGAAERTGIGLTLLPVLYRFGGSGRRPLEPSQARFGNDLDRFARLVDGIRALSPAAPGDWRLGIAPHSLRAVDREGIEFAAELAGEGPVHIHAAEQNAEVEEVNASLNARPVEWLLSEFDVGPRWCLVHATQMQPHETTALAHSGAVAGLCPITEANLGDGIFDGVRFIEAGGRFGIGSDSNIRISLAEELRMLEYSQRLRDKARACLATPTMSAGRTLFEGAARGGAQAAGRDGGGIAPGRLADMMALDMGTPTLHGKSGDTLLDAFVFTGGEGLVTDVWSAGRHVVEDGRHALREPITRCYLNTLSKLSEAL